MDGLDLKTNQILMSMLARCLRCGREHDGYTPCRPGELTPAERARIPPLERNEVAQKGDGACPAENPKRAGDTPHEIAEDGGREALSGQNAKSNPGLS